jgi:hypothetical protein
VIYTPRAGDGLLMLPEYTTCARIYKEALNSNSPMYSFLCFFCILEWANKYQAERATRAKERGEEPPTLPDWHIPASMEEMRRWTADLFPGGVLWSIFALEAMFPAESRGKSIGSIYQTLEPIRHSIAHNLGLETDGVFTPHEDIENLELVQRWLPLAYCLVRRRLQDFFPDLIAYQARAVDQPSE